MNIRNEGIILEKTERDFENQAVLNPSCIEKDGVIHMFYRAVEKGNFSTIGYCQLDQNNTVIYRRPTPLIVPEHKYERHGVEDPRVILFEGLYYMFYTAYDGENALVAYATSTDLIHFTKHGLLTPKMKYAQAAKLMKQSPTRSRYQWYALHLRSLFGSNVLLWEKDAFIFPRRISGDIIFVHRIMPGIQFMRVKDFSEVTPEYWKRYLSTLSENIVLDSEYWFESRKIGGSCPPIETDAGWLFIYHSVEDNIRGRIYHACAALLDKDNPWKVIARLPEPLFSPTEGWEKQGDVSNVVFPSSTFVRDGRLYVYYGAADSRIGLRSMVLDELIQELQKHKV